MGEMAGSQDSWIRRFAITETSKHQKNFTIYKVSYMVNSKTSIVWKRYSEFRKLHSEMKFLHSKAQIWESFPSFSKRKIFGRFEDEVVEERKLCALNLLEFVGRHSILCKSEVFEKFFSDSSQNISSENSEEGEEEPQFQANNQRLLNFDESHFEEGTIIHDGSDLTELPREVDQYLLIAAAHMSAAFRHEAIAEYEEAFIQYKLGISHLINGVKNEGDIEKKFIIQQKISKYLSRAERLYGRHLNCKISIEMKPVTILEEFKIVKLVGSLMVVKDNLQMFTRIIKTIEKVVGSGSDVTNYVLRGRVPFMTQLFACTQTDTTIFLILQYVSKGKLWDFLKTDYKPNSKTLSNGKTFPKSLEAEVNLFEKDYSANKIPEETNFLLQNAQKLLKSVSATLKRSNTIANRLNESEYLLSKTKFLSSIRSVDSISKTDAPLNNDSISLDEENENSENSGGDISELSIESNQPLSPISNHSTNNLSSNGETPLGEKTINCRSHSEQKMWQVPESVVRDWAAQILLSLEALHQQNVVVLDLRSDNILIDDNGHVILTYVVPRKNPELLKLKKPYTSPELCMFTPPITTSTSADVWSFGVIFYELLTGYDFQSKHLGQFYSHSVVYLPEDLSSAAKSLLQSILKYHPEERLTIPEIKQHAFFFATDWLELLNL